MIIKVETTFDAAHRLMHHEGKCRNLHGHHYRVVWAFQGKVNALSDMVEDFGTVKKRCAHYTDEFDHTTILNPKDDKFIDFLLALGCKINLIGGEPTAESMAEWFALVYNWNQSKKHKSYKLISVTVYETETNSAMWTA